MWEELYALFREVIFQPFLRFYGLIRSAAAVVFTALDGAVAVVKMHEAVYLVVEIAETGAVTYKIITPEYARMSN